MEVAAIGAAASFSLADVSYDEAKLKEGSQCSCMGMMTLLLAAAAGTCQGRFHSNDDKELLQSEASSLSSDFHSLTNMFSHNCTTVTLPQLPLQSCLWLSKGLRLLLLPGLFLLQSLQLYWCNDFNLAG